MKRGKLLLKGGSIVVPGVSPKTPIFRVRSGKHLDFLIFLPIFHAPATPT